MSWADGFMDATYQTKTSTVGAGVPSVYWSKRFLEFLVEKLILAPFAQKRPLPEGNGVTAEFFRWRPIAPTFSALTEGVNPDATKIYGQKIQVAVKEYGNFTQLSSLLKKTHIDTGLEGAVDILAEQAAETMDGLCHREMCSNGTYPLAADLSTTSTFSGALTTVTSTTDIDGGALLEANSNYGDADDDLNQSIITMLSGPAKGQSRIVTDYDADGAATGTDASGAMTISPAFDMTPEVGDLYIVTTPDEIASGDDLSYANMKKARTILKKNLANTYRGGYFVMVAGPDAYNDLMDDSDWKNVMTYKDQTKGIFDGEVGKFAGVRCVETTSPFVFPIEARGTAGTGGGPGVNGANFDVTGHVQTALVFGKNSFGVTTFKKQGGQAIKPPIIIKPVGSGGSSDPLNRYGTVGWQMDIGHKALYSLHAVGIWCYY